MSETKVPSRPKLPSWQLAQITAFFSYKEYALASRANKAVHRLFTEALDRGQISGTVFVPGQCTLEQAVDWVNEDETKTTIVVGRGEYPIDRFLNIFSAVNIVGDPRVPREEIVVLGGIRFRKRVGLCHLQHLTLRRSYRNGVYAESSFTMEDVLVERCGGYGVFAYGADARCTDVEVRQCGWSGVMGDGASITLVKTSVHDNCKRRRSRPYQDYDLKVSNGSRILLVSPLNIGTIGAGYAGDIEQITIAPVEPVEPMEPVESVESVESVEFRL